MCKSPETTYIALCSCLLLFHSSSVLFKPQVGNLWPLIGLSLPHIEDVQPHRMLNSWPRYSQ
ncbi:hypothetical protein CIPAW_15G157100 [Carya illinoinensis]|uniref:Uncharacterized protein n=1 Tax=Carya illinoinensis TaxID=32201 RepID=A0A8T1NDZ4_CARIL|nr:hypothetical protein CIPAW_15G157100 [Carya illinoinensis]